MFLATYLPPQRSPTSLILYLENNQIPFYAVATLEEIVIEENVEETGENERIEATPTEALRAWAQALAPVGGNKAAAKPSMIFRQNPVEVAGKKENEPVGEEKIAVEQPLPRGNKPKKAFLLIYLPPERMPTPLIQFLNTGHFQFFAHSWKGYEPTIGALWAWFHTLDLPEVPMEMISIDKAKEKPSGKKKASEAAGASKSKEKSTEKKKIEAEKPLSTQKEEPRATGNETAAKEDINQNIDVIGMEDDSAAPMIENEEKESEAVEEPVEKKPELCPVANCPDTFTSSAALSAHLRHHVSPAPCRQCGKSLSRPSYLRCHYLRHQQPKKTYKCTECPRRYKRGIDLRVHLRTHTGERLFGCSFCERRFYLRGHMRKHETVHTGERPYGCTECALRFNCSSTLTRHLRIHTGELPFTCTECHKQFRTEENCRDHMSKHRGEKAYGCERCGEKYYYRSQMSKHRKKGCQKAVGL